MKKKSVFNWSGGKDSALCLYKILNDDEFDVMCLLTSVNETHNRISMHGVRAELLDAQAESIGLPLVKLEIPESTSMDEYDKRIGNKMSELKQNGALYSIFGDIFLEDLRQYREERLNSLGLEGVFPLWKIPTIKVLTEFIQLGFKTIITCVNEKYLDKSFAGRIIDSDFITDLPSNVDPCGENGEFHTFVFDGPIFKNPVRFRKGDVVYRQYKTGNNENDPDSKENKGAIIPDNGFWYCDLIPLTV